MIIQEEEYINVIVGLETHCRLSSRKLREVEDALKTSRALNEAIRKDLEAKKVEAEKAERMATQWKECYMVARDFVPPSKQGALNTKLEKIASI